MGKTIHKDEINHAYVGVEDGLEQDSSLDALDWDLSGDLLDCNVMCDLNQ